MERAMTGAMYLFGFAGFAGIVLIPLRSFIVTHRLANFWDVSIQIRMLIIAFAVVAFALLVAEAQLLHGVSRCLLGERCGPNRASGWLLLAGIGFWYAALELIVFAIGYAVRKAVRRTSASG